MNKSILYSCNKNEIRKNTRNNSFEENLTNKIDYVLDSTKCNGGLDRMLQIRHEKYKGRDYVQIAPVYNYHSDSMYYCIEYRGNFVAIYNKDFFDKKVKYNESNKENLLNKYNAYDAKNSNTMISDKRCFEMFEVSNRILKRVSHDSYYYNNLFSNPPMSEPPLPPLHNKAK